jgi:hypothetical protein
MAMLPQTGRRANILGFDGFEILIIAAGVVVALMIALAF